MTKLIPIGHGQFVNASKVIAVVVPRRGAKDKNILDVTLHRKRRSMIVMDTGLRVLSFLSVETLKERLNEN